MTLDEAIKQRHSVRKYLDKKIEKETIDKLNEKISELNKDGNIKLILLEDGGNAFNRLLSKAMGLGSAPSVIACLGPDDDTVEERIGYYGEQLVLYAQQLGLNTCWAGTFNKGAIESLAGEGEKAVIVIAIGYGASQGRVRKSKKPDQVTMIHGNKPDGFDQGVEYALLAPTAINQQKFLICSHDESVKIEDKGGIFSKVDLGIVKCHFEIGSGITL